MLDWSVAPPDGLSIPPPHILGPGRLTGKAYTSMGSLLWLPVSRVQSMEGTNTRLDGAQAIAMSLLGNTALSKFQYLLCPLLVITSYRGVTIGLGWQQLLSSHGPLHLLFSPNLPTTVHTCAGQAFICIPKGLWYKSFLSTSRCGILNKRVYFQTVPFMAICTLWFYYYRQIRSDFLTHILWSEQNYSKTKVRTEMPTKESIQRAKWQMLGISNSKKSQPVESSSNIAVRLTATYSSSFPKSYP